MTNQPGRKCDSACTHRDLVPNSNNALCTVCHQLFHTVEQFEGHRSAYGKCANPAKLGLTLEEGIWSTTEGHVKRREIAERLHGKKK